MTQRENRELMKIKLILSRLVSNQTREQSASGFWTTDMFVFMLLWIFTSSNLKKVKVMDQSILLSAVTEHFCFWLRFRKELACLWNQTINLLPFQQSALAQILRQLKIFFFYFSRHWFRPATGSALTEIINTEVNLSWLVFNCQNKGKLKMRNCHDDASVFHKKQQIFPGAKPNLQCSRTVSGSVPLFPSSCSQPPPVRSLLWIFNWY